VADSPPLSAVGGSAYPRGASDADRAITAMYDTEYPSLVRMSAVLLGDVLAAEEVVQASFIAVHAAWRRLRDIEKALPYLRRSVLSRSRSLLRHQVVTGRHRVAAGRHQLGREPARPGAGRGAVTPLGCPAVIAALRGLPARQQEALVLTFYLGLSEPEVAAAMNISRGAARSLTARGQAALRTVLGPQP
jgi:DNA-directed RNA polymerase specialized sigma24 family protein